MVDKVFFDYTGAPGTRRPWPTDASLDPKGFGREWEQNPIHFHCNPPRPADYCITLDPDTGDVNIMAGTIGPLTWRPFTICLHIDRANSKDTYRNLQASDECVISLPGWDLLQQTWMVNFALPRGINEAEVARLTLYSSRVVKPPSVAECPINLECKVEFFKDYYTHGIVFVRVIASSVDKELLTMSREEALERYPTYEVDSVSNEWGGTVERLGSIGTVKRCPTFPVGWKRGFSCRLGGWLEDLLEEGCISQSEHDLVAGWHKRWEEVLLEVDSPERQTLKTDITKFCELVAWQEWEDLHQFLAKDRM
jgi:flavin reductase (DIM6/NTAB) family NADH-FMN oxidoreductase RutF